MTSSGMTCYSDVTSGAGGTPQSFGISVTPIDCRELPQQDLAGSTTKTRGSPRQGAGKDAGALKAYTAKEQGRPARPRPLGW